MNIWKWIYKNVIMKNLWWKIWLHDENFSNFNPHLQYELNGYFLRKKKWKMKNENH